MGGVERLGMDGVDGMSILGEAERDQDRGHSSREEQPSESVPCFEELEEKHREDRAEEATEAETVAVASFSLESPWISEENPTENDDAIVDADRELQTLRSEEPEETQPTANEGMISMETDYAQVSSLLPSPDGASEEKADADDMHQEHLPEEEIVAGSPSTIHIIEKTHSVPLSPVDVREKDQKNFHLEESREEEGIANVVLSTTDTVFEQATVLFHSESGESQVEKGGSNCLFSVVDSVPESVTRESEDLLEKVLPQSSKVPDETLLLPDSLASNEEFVEEIEERFTLVDTEVKKLKDVEMKPMAGEAVESAPIVAMVVEETDEAFTRLEELKAETSAIPMNAETVDEPEMTCTGFEELKVEAFAVAANAERMDVVAGMTCRGLEELKVEETFATPASGERVEEAAEMTYTGLEELKVENFPMPVIGERVEGEMADTRLDELNVEEAFPLPTGGEGVEEAGMAYTISEKLKVEETFPVRLSGERVDEAVEVTFTRLDELKVESFATPITTDGASMESELKPVGSEVMKTSEEVEKRSQLEEAIEVDVKPKMETVEKMEARTLIEVTERVESSSIIMNTLDDLGQLPTTSDALEERNIPERMELDKINNEKTFQSIIDTDFPMGGDVGFIAPVDYFTEEGDQEEMVGSMMGVQENNEGTLEDDSRKGGRKRGRPPKSQAGKTPPKKKEKEEEDVCFICFDGGNLVLCDRRGCPKVYHPSCVNRDEAFFRSKGKWNCGWHICSICEKAAHYMCFTCTYSLCKSCIKDSQFVCVRGNKGLCETCRSTVILIETNELEKKSVGGVNFDDRSSWEYLFKDYWLDLKGKLSITLEEVSRAKNPWKGSSFRNEDQSDEPYDASNDPNSSSDSSSGHHQRNKPTKKKVKKTSKYTRNGEQTTLRLPYKEDASTLAADSDWASNELLEFVAHMRNGDKSVMCQFDVHTLLLEYIKQNNLRDPRRKSQIVCDARLETLFGKARVGHFEMLKLLESHFLTKESSLVATDDNQGSVLDPDSSQMDNEGNSNLVLTAGSDKKQKSRKKTGKGERQSNLDDYAAIDVHNINLLYLRRNLMEELLGDPEFREKVVGSFVRIRISGAGLRKDMYRLVPVTGTSRAEEKYKSGKRATDIALEILNLSKTEVVSVDSISNQEFTEEECKRLRQSIKCGLINRLKVGDIQEKAQALQSMRVNESLENEKLRISHLRDRASEKGHRKELRECVEKLLILNSPEERARRLNEVPVVNADPKMDPNYESDEEEFINRRPESFSRSRDSSFSAKRRESAHSSKGNTAPVSSGYSENNGAAVKIPRKENLLSSPTPAVDPGLTAAGGSKSPMPLTINENEKMWHYKDPSGKIQGPFSMTQLRKWNTTGYFPSNLRIWKASEKEDESILLTDALLGKFHKYPSSPKMPLTVEGGRNELSGQPQSPFLGNQYQLAGQGRGSPGQVNAWATNTRAGMVNSHSSGDCLTPTPRSEQAKFDEKFSVDSRRNSFEGHQKYNFMSAPNEVLSDSGVSQNYHRNPGHSRSSTSEQRSEWSMPSPTPTVEPSRYDPGKQTERGMGQDTTAATTVMGGAPASMAATVQGHGGTAWGALMQGNPAGVWATPSQTNPSAAISWVPPPPIPPPPPPPPATNPNMNNLMWMAQAQAQAQAQAYPGWSTPVQGAVNLNAGWFPAAPATLQQIPNWGLPPQPGPPNPNQSWVVPSTDSSGGSGGQVAPPDSGICKFYERGHCRKGDSCNYRHYR